MQLLLLTTRGPSLMEIGLTQVKGHWPTMAETTEVLVWVMTCHNIDLCLGAISQTLLAIVLHFPTVRQERPHGSQHFVLFHLVCL